MKNRCLILDSPRDGPDCGSKRMKSPRKAGIGRCFGPSDGETTARWKLSVFITIAYRNKEVGLLYTVKQGGRVYTTESRMTSLANLGVSSLCKGTDFRS